jgi:hypothetical protein
MPGGNALMTTPGRPSRRHELSQLIQVGGSIEHHQAPFPVRLQSVPHRLPKDLQISARLSHTQGCGFVSQAVLHAGLDRGAGWPARWRACS